LAVRALGDVGRANGLAFEGLAGARPGDGGGAYTGGGTGPGGAGPAGPRMYCTGGSMSAKSPGDGRIACSGWVSGRMGAAGAPPPPLRPAGPAT
jgi:hypothetical protein